MANRRGRGQRKQRDSGESPKAAAQSPRAVVEEVIDEFIRAIGLNPAEQVGPNGWRYFKRGSASGFAFLDEVNDQLFFHAAAHVMTVPADKALILPLFRELLELNGTLQGSARLALRDNDVFVAVSLLVNDELRPQEIIFSIHQVMEMADGLDDVLRQKYQGTTRKKQEPALAAS